MDAMKTLHQSCLSCVRCPLSETRTKLVFGVGNVRSRIMFIGEGPGEQEDLSGEPFVGPAGKLLDIELKLIGLDRKDVYIANIVKCRPPHNRDPRPEEREACIGWLQQQIALIDPKIIVCLGRISATTLISQDFRITREHGQWHTIDGRQFIATYHPSALLRDESKRPDAFSDFRLIRQALQKLSDEGEETQA